MSASELAEAPHVGGTPGSDPSPYPWWVWFSLATLTGAYAGWWGVEYWSWPPPLGVIGAVIGLGVVGASHDWFMRLRRSVGRPWLALLIVLVYNGLAGGLLFGITAALSGLVVAVSVGWITDGNVRVVAGATLSALASGIAVLQVSRQQARRLSERQGETKNTSAGCASVPTTAPAQGSVQGNQVEPKAAADGGRDSGSS